MEIQVFGTRHCNETKKALRFFAERRIKVHFVDLEVRAAAVGELRRFGQKLGWDALLDLHGKRFQARHLRLSSFAESQVLPLIEADPLLLVTPLIRSGNDVAIGWDEGVWRVRVKPNP